MYLGCNLSLIFCLILLYNWPTIFVIVFLKNKVCVLPTFRSFISSPGLDNSLEAHLFKAKCLMNTDRVRLYFIGRNQLASYHFS